MSGKMSRNKGQRAEREFIKMLQEVVDNVYGEREDKPVLKRNLFQTMEGGYDIVGVDWLALEVKHHETLNLNSWWKQTIDQTKQDQVPVLAYKQNRRGWRIRMMGILRMNVVAVCDISVDDFLRFFKYKLEANNGQ